MSLVKRLILNIASLKFAISLIIFIAITSGLGTFIPQGNNASEYFELYNSNPIFGVLNGNTILLLELDHIYTSKWFLLSLILLCISLAACSFRRQIPSLKATFKWINYDNEKKFHKLKLNSNWEIGKKNRELIINSERILDKKGWQSLITENKISSRKGIVGKFGPIIVHIGLIFLLIGSAYGNLTNKSQELFLIPNEEIDLINDRSNKKLNVKLLNFKIEREFDGKPKQFISNLNFKSDQSKENNLKETKVNHPLRYRGLTIYQADWAISSILIKIDDVFYNLKVKPIPEIGDQIWGIVIQLGKEIKNNYLLTVDNENGPLKIFDIRDFKQTDIYLDKNIIEINKTKIELLEIVPSSGLIIKSDPSVPFIYFSFILIIIGTFLSLIPTKQLWILINRKSNKIYIGGLSNRNLAGFEKEFKSIIGQIKDC